MSLYVARDDGTGSFFPDEGLIDLVQIADFDLGFGQTDDPSDTKGVHITYDRSDTGIPPQRLDDLVNEISYSGVDIVVFPVDSTFVLTPGIPITEIAGVALPLGHELSPTPDDLVVFYDTSQCNGSGWWVDAEDGGRTDFPRPVILYHELSHSIRDATGTSNPDLDQEEAAAATDENDMRDQMHIPHRDVTSHDGGCGGGLTACCIVASVASGSPYSAQVNALRRIRDHFLRRGRVGEDFFRRLHYDYYAFSPEVCRLMGRSRSVHDLVRDRFVYPLLLGLELVRAYSERRGDIETLGRVLAEGLQGCPAGLAAPADLLAGLDEVDFGVAAATALASRYVSWGLVDMLAVATTAAERLRAGAPAAEVGAGLRAALDEWAGRMPISPIWAELSSGQAAAELHHLGELLLWNSDSRQTFGRRLAEHHPGLRPRVQAWLAADVAAAGRDRQ